MLVMNCEPAIEVPFRRRRWETLNQMQVDVHDCQFPIAYGSLNKRNATHRKMRDIPSKPIQII
jgi:hypothetical protein